jgi:hypothetical protein
MIGRSVKVLARLAAGVALLTLGGCAMFYSTAPVYAPGDGQPAYGADIRGVEMRGKPDEKPLKLSSVWREGVYVHVLREHGRNSTAVEDQVTETLTPLPGLAAHFVSQRQVTDDEGKVLFYYDLIVRGGPGFLVYNMACTDLTEAERRQFNFAPASPAPQPPGPPAEAQNPPDCEVRTRADLEAAFTLIAGRKQPAGEIKVLAKRRALFQR